jgi:hypothetical protein
LYVRQDGMHAFIRDAALGAAQAQRVAQALSCEMAAAGQKLAAVTVNGQPLAAYTSEPGAHPFSGEVRDAQQPVSRHRSSIRKGHSQ